MVDYANLNYSRLTVNDRNPLKRALQNKRLEHGLRELTSLPKNYRGKILDFGSGDGEFCKRISQLLKKTEVVCYEPSNNLRSQAEENISGIEQIKIESSIKQYPDDYFDYIFCLEVFEHLTGEKIEEELLLIKRLTKPGAKIVVGVPNEIYFAALIKGLLRLKRRYGEVDARVLNILRAAAGFPPRQRPVVLFDGLPYIIRHMGFDHRKFKKQLQKHFKVLKSYGSPNVSLPLFANFEIYFVCQPQ